MAQSLADILPSNPRYGAGTFRRRILLKSAEGHVLCELEDDCHGFRVTVHHDGTITTRIEAQTIRAPVDICEGAADAIRELTGQPLSEDRQSLARVSHPTKHCTHIYDLVVLATDHALQPLDRRQYDIEIDDEVDGIVDAKISLNYHLMHRWLVRTDYIESPRELAGLPTAKGASRWDLSSQDGVSSAEFGPGIGVCYTYAADRVHTGKRVKNSIRDFAETPEELLKFR